ncbi:unnamed protein product [Amoebophrya sp. A120]|nr:unnamed protein product [Amoebophrya sp. A120]|eukprot:GSA120T00002479001.1
MLAMRPDTVWLRWTATLICLLCKPFLLLPKPTEGSFSPSTGPRQSRVRQLLLDGSTSSLTSTAGGAGGDQQAVATEPGEVDGASSTSKDHLQPGATLTGEHSVADQQAASLSFLRQPRYNHYADDLPQSRSGTPLREGGDEDRGTTTATSISAQSHPFEDGARSVEKMLQLPLSTSNRGVDSAATALERSRDRLYHLGNLDVDKVMPPGDPRPCTSPMKNLENHGLDAYEQESTEASPTGCSPGLSSSPATPWAQSPSLSPDGDGSPTGTTPPLLSLDADYTAEGDIEGTDTRIVGAQDQQMDALTFELSGLELDKKERNLLAQPTAVDTSSTEKVMKAVEMDASSPPPEALGKPVGNDNPVPAEEVGNDIVEDPRALAKQVVAAAIEKASVKNLVRSIVDKAFHTAQSKQRTEAGQHETNKYDKSELASTAGSSEATAEVPLVPAVPQPLVQVQYEGRVIFVPYHPNEQVAHLVPRVRHFYYTEIDQSGRTEEQYPTHFLTMYHKWEPLTEEEERNHKAQQQREEEANRPQASGTTQEEDAQKMSTGVENATETAIGPASSPAAESEESGEASSPAEDFSGSTSSAVEESEDLQSATSPSAESAAMEDDSPNPESDSSMHDDSANADSTEASDEPMVQAEQAAEETTEVAETTPAPTKLVKMVGRRDLNMHEMLGSFYEEGGVIEIQNAVQVNFSDRPGEVFFMGCSTYFEAWQGLRARALALWERVTKKPLPANVDAVLTKFTGPYAMAGVKEVRPIPADAIPVSHDMTLNMHFPVSGVRVRYDGLEFIYPLTGTARVIDIKKWVQNYYTSVLGYSDRNRLSDIDVWIGKGGKFVRRAENDEQTAEAEALLIQQERAQLAEQLAASSEEFERESMGLEDVRIPWQQPSPLVAQNSDQAHEVAEGDAAERKADLKLRSDELDAQDKEITCLLSEVDTFQQKEKEIADSSPNTRQRHEDKLDDVIRRLRALKAEVERNLHSLKRDLVKTAKRHEEVKEEVLRLTGAASSACNAAAVETSALQTVTTREQTKKPQTAKRSKLNLGDMDILDLSLAPKLLKIPGEAITLNFRAPKNERRTVTVLFDLVPGVLIRMPLLGLHETFDNLQSRVLHFLTEGAGQGLGRQLAQTLRTKYGASFNPADLAKPTTLLAPAPNADVPGSSTTDTTGRGAATTSETTDPTAPRRVVGLTGGILQYLYAPVALKASDGTYEAMRNPELEIQLSRAVKYDALGSASIESAIDMLRIEHFEVQLMRLDWQHSGGMRWVFPPAPVSLSGPSESTTTLVCSGEGITGTTTTAAVLAEAPTAKPAPCPALPLPVPPPPSPHYPMQNVRAASSTDASPTPGEDTDCSAPEMKSAAEAFPCLLSAENAGPPQATISDSRPCTGDAAASTVEQNAAEVDVDQQSLTESGSLDQILYDRRRHTKDAFGLSGNHRTGNIMGNQNDSGLQSSAGGAETTQTAKESVLAKANANEKMNIRYHTQNIMHAAKRSDLPEDFPRNSGAASSSSSTMPVGAVDEAKPTAATQDDNLAHEETQSNSSSTPDVDMLDIENEGERDHYGDLDAMVDDTRIRLAQEDAIRALRRQRRKQSKKEPKAPTGIDPRDLQITRGLKNVPFAAMRHVDWNPHTVIMVEEQQPSPQNSMDNLFSPTAVWTQDMEQRAWQYARDQVHVIFTVQLEPPMEPAAFVTGGADSTGRGSSSSTAGASTQPLQEDSSMAEQPSTEQAGSSLSASGQNLCSSPPSVNGTATLCQLKTRSSDGNEQTVNSIVFLKPVASSSNGEREGATAAENGAGGTRTEKPTTEDVSETSTGPPAPSSAAAASVAPPLPPPPVPMEVERPEAKKPDPPKKNRCRVCNKRVGLTGFSCPCGGLFCSKHRYGGDVDDDNTHLCDYDHKTQGKKQLQKQLIG